MLRGDHVRETSDGEDDHGTQNGVGSGGAGDTQDYTYNIYFLEKKEESQGNKSEGRSERWDEWQRELTTQ